MEIQFLNSNKITKIINTQNNVVRYYAKLAHITTEDDLEGIFQKLENNHKVYKDRLITQLYPNQSTIQFSLKKGKSLLGKMWDEMLVAVLVNNRPRLIEYSRQNEIKLIQNLQNLIFENKISPEIKEILISYEKSIYDCLERLEELPTVKLFKRKVA